MLKLQLQGFHKKGYKDYCLKEMQHHADKLACTNVYENPAALFGELIPVFRETCCIVSGIMTVIPASLL
jgi:hypothetical protein